jgi:predicted transcriptional regulator of viral defense system
MRTIMPLPATYRRQLHELAVEQYGYVTTRDAARLGLPEQALRQVADWGGLTRVAFGVYRFDDIPATGRDSFIEAVLAVGDDAFLMADAVLALHDLALVNPTRLRVGVPRRFRGNVPPIVQVVWKVVPANDLEVFEHIPCTTVARALVDSVGIVMGERLRDAAREAADRGLLRRSDIGRVRDRIGGEL